MSGLTEFILAHEGEDTSRLLLSRGKWPGVDMDLAVSTIESRRKIRSKLPSWHAEPGLLYPSTLSAEQCSSEETALYKASMLKERIGGGSVADLTGGLGVDSIAFAKAGYRVLYNEMNPALADAARHNFPLLLKENVPLVSNAVVEPGSLDGILGDLSPDVIFLDPARRSGEGRKVFMLQDCSPDLTTLKPGLFARCRHIVAKLSPMADISLTVKTLGNVREVHIVSSKGECKELLLWMDREYGEEGFTLVVSENGRRLEFPSDAESRARVTYCDSPSDLAGGWLFEPGKSLSKAGLFNTVSEHFGLKKLSPGTHLYCAPNPEKVLSDFGKLFKIKEIYPLSSATIKALGKQRPEAEITARNIPLTSDELRRRLKARPSASEHIFATRLGPDPILILCSRDY